MSGRSYIGALLVRVSLVLSLMLLCVSAPAAGPICDKCDEEINEPQFVNLGDRQFHNYHFRCAECTKILSETGYRQLEGEYYDPACYGRRLADLCPACFKPVTKKWFVHEKKKYHPDCYFEAVAPTCEHCSEKITTSWIEHEGHKYHRDCYEENVDHNCLICGKTIEGEYLLDTWGNHYCAKHEDEKRCDYCQRIVSDQLTGGSTTYDDGRLICGQCHETAIDEDTEAQRLMLSVAGRLGAFGIIVKADKLPLELVSQPTLRLLSGETHPNHDPTGLATFERTSLASGMLKLKDFRIYALYGMPRLMLESVLAHELMHIWQYEHGLNEAVPPLVEGSSNYASFLILRDIDHPDAARLMSRLHDDPGPVYGGGFRQVSDYVNKVGVGGWLEYLKGNSRLP